MITAEILKLITTKVSEHEIEVRGCSDKIEELQNKKNAFKHAKGADGFLGVIRQLGILKDKAVFHKACIAALQDLKEDINGQKVHKQDQK